MSDRERGVDLCWEEKKIRLEHDSEFIIETYKSLTPLALQVFKTLVIINGGALIALMSYLTAHKGSTVLFWYPAISFSLGLVACILMGIFSYLTQHSLLNVRSAHFFHQSVPRDRHATFLLCAILAGLFSVLVFLVGAFCFGWAVVQSR